MPETLKTLTSEFSLSGPARSLASWATDILRQAILNGYFKPGERLDQEAIAKELSVSRTPLREAVAALESEGLLESRPHRGVFVTRISKKDIRDVFALRALLEAEVARQAASSIPDSILDRLETALKDAQTAYENGDHIAQFEADRHFHETLRAFTENDLLKEVLNVANNRITAVRRFAQTKPGSHVDKFAEEHLAILRAIKDRDPEKAASLMRRHLQNSGARVEELAEEKI
jgi:DNA-binding GntR family transcriptional regulator